MIIEPAVWALGATIFSGGVAAGGVKVMLNGTKERVRKIEDTQADHNDRLARIETKLDIVIDHLERD